MAFKNIMLRTIDQLVSIILAFYIDEYHLYESKVRLYFTTVKRLVDERGLSFTVKYVKSSRLAVTRYLTGHPLTSLEGVALSNGWPNWLTELKPLIENESGLKILMTLLVSLRSIHLTPVLDTSPITKEWCGFSSITDREFKHALRRLRISSRPVEWKSFHMSTKKGPLGQAILTAVTELTLLPSELISSITKLGGSKLSRVITALTVGRFNELSLASIWATLFPPKSQQFRKLSYFSDKEGKTRVIAILDYWSQTALRPLHEALFSILRRIPQDCTFDQGAFTSILPSKGPYYSLDLSNATDRMPLLLQKRVISAIVGEERAEAWAHVLVGYGYTAKGYPVPFSYGAGQPMGAYSSWGAMAVTHHILVCISALRCNKPHFKDYCILGDDIVIANAAVAEAYKSLLSELDMPISEAKTHVSNDTYEFAKRWIHNGVEITGFACSGLRSVWKRYSLLRTFLENQRLHGWCLTIDKHPGLIRAIYKLFGKPAEAERAIKLYIVFDELANAKDTGVYTELLSKFCCNFGVPTSWLDSGIHCHAKVAKAILVEAKKRLIERDFERFQKDAYSVSAKLTGTFLAKFPDLSVQDYRAALRGNHPLVTVLNDMIRESAVILSSNFGRSVGIQTARSSQFQAIQGSEGEISPETYLEKVGLSKYFVSKGVFSMRASHSINLAQSMVVKMYLDVLREVAVHEDPSRLYGWDKLM